MLDFATLVRTTHPHLADYLDDSANEQADLLRVNGLDVLNDRVLASPRAEVLDVVAEHNMAAVLLRRGFTEMAYEPASMQRPVDLAGLRAARVYRVEVKRLAASEHDALHSTVMQALNTALESHTEGVLIQIHLRETFEAADINPLVRHVKKALRDTCMEKVHAFASDEVAVAWYTFHPAASATHPRIATIGDIDMRDVTGVDAWRVRGKVRRAYEKFKVCPEDDAVQLLALEVDNTIDLASVAEALYGSEYATFTRHGHQGSGRHPGGAFSGGLHSRLCGLLVVRRGERERFRLFTSYSLILFWNPGRALTLGGVAEALQAEKALGPDDFP